MAEHHCIEHPHFPPHCGCKAGSAVQPEPRRTEALLKSTAVGMTKMAQDLAGLKAQADAVEKQVRSLGKAHLEPAAVRRAAMHQVWWCLVEAGHFEAATLVRDAFITGEGQS